MRGSQKIGGVGALLQGVLSLSPLVFVFVVLRVQGIFRLNLDNPDILLPFVASSPIMNIFHLTDVLFAASLVLTVLALYDRLQEGSSGLVRIATVYGLGSAVLLLATGFISVFAVSALAGLYPQNQAGAGLAWRAVDSMLGGMQKAQLFAYGWWILLVSWAALKGGGLPRPLNYVGLLLGVMAGIIGMATDSAGLTQLVLVVIWNLWLGVVLLRG